MSINILHISNERLICEATNMIRYNPRLALEWFKEAYAKVEGTKFVPLYNRGAKEANDYLASLYTMRYYKKEEVWGDKYFKPEMIPLHEEVLNFNEELEKMILANKL